ncbi:MAG: CPBP family intramembrane metalloprotease [Candidatus Lokiarchaeota archaeon]|nr:CPBP family intramembrane metalloprotease [Candidatus Lokiarchaeota archaeon]MBD3202502.1 CPBP family intramembrane metalloprotease [Candidatus Lokiarchaeota archaeon]
MERFSLRNFIVNHKVGTFFVLTYFISWLGFLPSLLGSVGFFVQFSLLIAQFGPTISAIIVILPSKDSLKDWFMRIIKWKVPLYWWLITIFVPISIFTITSFFFALLGFQIELSQLISSLIAYFPSLLGSTLMAGLGEEPGWRGLALPQIEKKYNPLKSTLILGTVWAFWHLPVFFIDPRSSHGITNPWVLSLMIFLTAFGIILYSFFYTWIYNHTKSILLMMILHGGFNAATVHLIPFADVIVFGPTYIILLSIQVTILFVFVIILLLLTNAKLGYDHKKTSDSEQDIKIE